jgi:dienelactone hydrolase
VSYASGESNLAMDVYRPADTSRAAPALILYALYWPEDNDRPARVSNDHVKRWARIAAGHGIVAIVPDLRAMPGTGTPQAPARARAEDFERLVAHLAQHSRAYGIDPERLAVFAASGSVASALPAVQDPRRSAIKAAVLYYGGAGADVARFRRDLPLLYVRAGSDSPAMNAAIDRLVALALTQNAPITVINHHTGHHAFEARDDDVSTRQVIDQTIDFVKRATAPEYQAVIRGG